MATVNLSWTASSPAPVNGYRVKYWPTATPANVVTVAPNPTGTTYSILNLPAGVSYSGTIEASCSGGTFSTPISWSVVATGGGTTTPQCFTHVVTADDGTSDRNSYEFTYTSCAGSPVTRSIMNLATVSVCARIGTITSEYSAINAEQGNACS